MFSITFIQVILLMLGTGIQKINLSIENIKMPCAMGCHIEISENFSMDFLPSIHVEICLLLN